jgi:hypothetical protein
MSIWWAIPAFVALVGVLSLIGGFGRLLGLRFITGTFRILFGGVLLAGAAVIGLVGLNLQTYARLTNERLAAEVTLRQTGPDAFTASVARANEAGVLRSPQEYPLTGDSFRIEADVITFKPWANILGADALYRFDRIQGRWADVAAENARPPQAHDMQTEEPGLNVFDLPLGPGNPFRRTDAEFIDGVAVPMADGAVYSLFMTQRGLIPRPKNEAAVGAQEAYRNRRDQPPLLGPRPGEPGQLTPQR